MAVVTKQQSSTMRMQLKSIFTNMRSILLRLLELQIPMVFGAFICFLLGLLIAPASSYVMIYHPGTYLYAAGDLLFLTVPVMVWMILRGHEWRHSLEMQVAMLTPVAAIILVGELGSFNYLRSLVIADYPAMCLGMLVYILYRSDRLT